MYICIYYVYICVNIVIYTNIYSTFPLVRVLQNTVKRMKLTHCADPCLNVDSHTHQSPKRFCSRLSWKVDTSHFAERVRAENRLLSSPCPRV